jgi:hypothetical protein
LVTGKKYVSEDLKFHHLGFANYICSPARVAELVDAADSKSAVRKDVLVRFQSRALKTEALASVLLFIGYMPSI